MFTCPDTPARQSAKMARLRRSRRLPAAMPFVFPATKRTCSSIWFRLPSFAITNESAVQHGCARRAEAGLSETYDLAIIGGGINGCGIARDAAGRGLSVFLCEQNDLASGTSSASTKLIHGGLRYLEYYEFRLVREALMEREVLWRMAPHIIWPLRFVLPHHKGLRPAWLLRLGLFLYDHLGGRKLLPPTRTLDLATDPAGKPLKPGEFTRGFEYSDCWVEDARLVALNARDAADRGAVIRTRTSAVSAERERDTWRLTVEDTDSGAAPTRFAPRILVNAAGPWVADVLSATSCGSTPQAKVRLVQGTHIVVRRLFDHDRCYIFQNADGRIIFAIPYETRFHPDRHHRPRLSGRPGQGRRDRGRDRLSLRRRLANISPSRSRAPTSSGPIPACGRSMTTARPRRRPRRATTCWSSTRPAGRRCSPSSAARSPPIAAWPSTRSRSSRRAFRRASRRSAAGRARRRCRAATSPSTGFDALVAELAREPSLARARPRPPPRPRLWHEGARRSSRAPPRSPRSAAASARR